MVPEEGLPLVCSRRGTRSPSGAYRSSNLSRGRNVRGTRCSQPSCESLCTNSARQGIRPPVASSKKSGFHFFGGRPFHLTTEWWGATPLRLLDSPRGRFFRRRLHPQA